MSDPAYKFFLQTTPHYYCWYCGRGPETPPGWNAPWLIERAHIVSKPRVEDRRVAVLLCSLCHARHHGENIVMPDEQTLPPPTTANMLWLKRHYDREYYDRKFMQGFSVARLPRSNTPPRIVNEAYAKRRGQRAVV